MREGRKVRLRDENTEVSSFSPLSYNYVLTILNRGFEEKMKRDRRETEKEKDREYRENESLLSIRGESKERKRETNVV
eukprot:528920-Amorphochlora_amoeboformis.AAC.1